MRDSGRNQEIREEDEDEEEEEEEVSVSAVIWQKERKRRGETESHRGETDDFLLLVLVKKPLEQEEEGNFVNSKIKACRDQRRGRDSARQEASIRIKEQSQRGFPISVTSRMEITSPEEEEEEEEVINYRQCFIRDKSCRSINDSRRGEAASFIHINNEYGIKKTNSIL